MALHSILLRIALAVLAACGLTSCAPGGAAPPVAPLPQVAQWSGLPLGDWPIRVRVDRTGIAVFATFQPAEAIGRPAQIIELASSLCGHPGRSDIGLFADCYPQFASSIDEAFPNGALATIARTQMEASFAAPRAPGRFPVVLLMGSVRGRGLDLISTAESIASHGYIVAVAAIDEAPERFGIDANTLALMRKALRDVAEAVAEEPYADMERLAFGAWSMGGAATTLEAFNDPRADAILSFDDALVYQYGVDLITAVPDYAPEEFTGVVFLATASIENPIPKSQQLVSAISAATITHTVAENMRHGDFSDQVRALPALAGGEASGGLNRTAHARVLREAVRALDEAMLHRIATPR